MKLGLILSLLLSVSAWAADDGNYTVKPNPEVTAGDFCSEKDPDFVGYRYAEKVAYCVRNVSWEDKTRIYTEYQIPEECRTEYTVDHFIPLFAGGSNHLKNLWPEHKHVKATRQTLEQDLYTELRKGRVSQREATEIIRQAKMNPPPVAPWRCR